LIALLDFFIYKNKKLNASIFCYLRLRLNLFKEIKIII